MNQTFDPIGVRVMITSGGGPGVWGLLHALRCWPGRRPTVIVSDPAPDPTLGTGLADVAARLPLAADPDYIPQLIDFCAAEKVDALVPVYDGELLAVAERRSDFEAVGTRVLLPPTDIVALCVDKLSTHQALAGGDLVPEYAVAQTADDVADAFDRLGYPQRKLCARPTGLAGGRGVYVIDEAAEDFLTRIHAKPGPSVCTAEQFLALRRTGPPRFPLLISEYLPGEELGVDVLCDDGRVVAGVIRRKGGALLHGNPARMQFAEQPGEWAWIERVVRELRLSSLVNIDARYDARGALKLLEVNARPSACVGLASAQVRLLAWALDRLLDCEQDPSAYETGRRVAGSLRVFADLVLDENGLFLLPLSNETTTMELSDASAVPGGAS